MFPPIGNALPPALGSYIAYKIENGAAPIPSVALDTSVPNAGPVVLDFGGRYQLAIYGGSLMSFEAIPVLGRSVDTSA